jgi:magnesium-transporting ATPase (P-type)
MDLIDNRVVKLGSMAHYVALFFVILRLIRWELIHFKVLKSELHSNLSIAFFLNETIIAALCLILAIVPEALKLAFIYCIAQYTTMEIFKKGDITIRDLKSLCKMSDIQILCLEKTLMI